MDRCPSSLRRRRLTGPPAGPSLRAHSNDSVASCTVDGTGSSGSGWCSCWRPCPSPRGRLGHSEPAGSPWTRSSPPGRVPFSSTSSACHRRRSSSSIPAPPSSPARPSSKPRPARRRPWFDPHRTSAASCPTCWPRPRSRPTARSLTTSSCSTSRPICPRTRCPASASGWWRYPAARSGLAWPVDPRSTEISRPSPRRTFAAARSFRCPWQRWPCCWSSARWWQPACRWSWVAAQWSSRWRSSGHWPT